jgi:hypothetical protein
MDSDSPSAEAGPTPRGFRPFPGPVGVEGFLLFFVIVQVAALGINFVRLLRLAAGITLETWSLGDVVPGFRPLIVSEVVMNLVLVVGAAFGLWLLSRKDARTPAYHVAFLCLVAVFGITEIVGAALVYPRLVAVVADAGNATDQLQQAQTQSLTGGFRMIIGGLLWAWYWHASERVANTFTRRAPADAAIARGA